MEPRVFVKRKHAVPICIHHMPFAIVLPIIYLRTRRLSPIIAAHWAANFVSVLALVILPLMER